MNAMASLGSISLGSEKIKTRWEALSNAKVAISHTWMRKTWDEDDAGSESFVIVAVNNDVASPTLLREA
jgi:hypothetical protein